MATSTLSQQTDSTSHAATPLIVDNALEAFSMGEQIIMEIDSIAASMVRSHGLSAYELRTFGTRLQTLSGLIGWCIEDHRGETVDWADLKERLTGVHEDDE